MLKIVVQLNIFVETSVIYIFLNLKLNIKSKRTAFEMVFVCFVTM